MPRRINIHSAGEVDSTNNPMERNLNRKKFFIIFEALIGVVFILCYWVFEIGMIFSLLACLPVAGFSIYLLINTPKTDGDKADRVN